MKYIRTKDDVYDTQKENEDNECIIQVKDDIVEKSYGGKNGRCILLPKDDVISQADTIEELCDEIVCFYKSWKTPFISKVENTNMEYVKAQVKDNNDYFVYGAIWTPEGLKYVAKMNKEGGLDLI